MSSIEIISLIVTIICLLSFCIAFTFLFRHYFLTSIEAINLGKEDRDIIEIAKQEYIDSKNKKNKVLSIVSKVASYLVLAIVVAFFGISLYSRFSNNLIPSGNSTLVVIASGSMSNKNANNEYVQDPSINNQFNTYDIIGISKYTSVNDVKLYDVVAYKSKQGTTIVHRVINIVDIDGKIFFETQGDANASKDSNIYYDGYLSYDEIYGYYNGLKIPGLGVFVVFLQSNAGIITIFAIIYCFFMYDFYSDKYKKSIETRTSYLVEKLKIDFAEDINLDEQLKVTYYEKLDYKGKTYIFEKGEIEPDKDSNLKLESSSNEVNNKNTELSQDEKLDKEKNEND